MTTWTKRGSPPTGTFLEGPITFKKMPNNFYYGGGGFIPRLVPKKLPSNFYDIAGEAYPGSYFVGKRSDNFVEVRPR